MHTDKHKTHLCTHTHWQGPGAHTRPEGITECGLAVAALGHVMGALHTYGTCKSFHKLLTYTQQTVSISTIEHVYRYATLLLGVRVCLGGVRINT